MISTLHGIGMTDGMITSSLITVFLSVLAIVAGRHLSVVPGKLQNVVEMAVEGLYNFFSDIMGRKLARMYLPLVGTLFIYILCCNYSGLMPGAGEINGIAAPTRSIHCTAAMAITVFLATQF
ncbi:MAG: F0F1 ATP synthase subunit A, partial [Firmicutes bacterium]|nr:F0F1 ATP synthase subunit A [Bacillota bacterium]